MAQEMMMEMPGAGTPAAEAGRGTDMIIAHLTPGEVVIPIDFLQDPDVAGMLQALFQQNGADLAEFTVGDPANKINPETGYPEFGWLSNPFRAAKKFVKKVIKDPWPTIGTIIGAATGNPFLAAAGNAAGNLASQGPSGFAKNIGPNLVSAGTAGIGSYVGGSAFPETSAALQSYIPDVGLGNALSNAYGMLPDVGIGSTLSSISSGLGSIGDTLGSSALGRDISSLSSRVSGLGSSLLNSVGLSSPASGMSAGESALLSNAQKATAGGGGTGFLSGILGGSSGGGSSFGKGLLASNLLGSLASGAGGVQTDAAIKKAKEQELLAQQQQLANLDTFDPSGITSDPGYEFNRAEGEKGLQRSLGASGNVFSGRALKAASDYNQSYANNAFKDYYQRWLTKTGAQNQLYGGTGDIKANATMAGSNNLAQTLSNIFGTQVGGYGNNSALLDLLLNRRGATA